jgi:putative NADH-flavin reductase
MKILIFGASGATGQHLVKQSLDQQHLVTAFVRDTGKLTIKHENLRMVQGNINNSETVEKAVSGQDAVFSALGAANPFKFDQVVVDSIGNIIKSMEAHQVKRFIYLSTIGGKDNRDDFGFFVRHIAPVLLKNEIAGHEAREQMIRKSQLDYTIVQAPKLTNGKFTGKYVCGEFLKRSSFLITISRADTAAFMLRQLSDPEYFRKTVRLMPA